MGVDEKKLREYFSEAPSDISLADIDMARIPGHVSIIMDGNGRWAQARGLDRSEGHVAGVASLRETVTTSVRLGLDVLSVYAFSTENWKRPQHEVDLLMHHLLHQQLVEVLRHPHPFSRLQSSGFQILIAGHNLSRPFFQEGFIQKIVDTVSRQIENWIIAVLHQAQAQLCPFTLGRLGQKEDISICHNSTFIVQSDRRQQGPAS